MASGNEPRPLSSNVLQITSSDTTKFEIVQANVRENAGVVCGIVLVKCLSDHSGGDIFNLGTTFVAYSFGIALVASGQWVGTPSRVLRAYINANGNVSIDAMTAGEYVTVIISTGKSV